jgi:hypothetical protein
VRIVFCEDQLERRSVDRAFAAEAEAAKAAGFEHVLVRHEALTREPRPAKATQLVPQLAKEELGLYRGWMLKPEQYDLLYESLLGKGIRLINDPAAYRHAHYLPESYAVIEGRTPQSVWMSLKGEVSYAEVMRLLSPFGSRPVIVKDFVKSQKHYWKEACFIPSASDREAVTRVVKAFIELQEDMLNEGLVFREFVEFEPIGTHPKSGMPLTREFRLFVLDGKPLWLREYWEEGDYIGARPSLEDLGTIMREVRSRFFTMDVAKRKDGGWMIVELGDGQVAGLPERGDPNEFYSALKSTLTS